MALLVKFYLCAIILDMNIDNKEIKSDSDDEMMNVQMDQSKASKIFLLIFLFSIIFSIGFSYWKIVVKRDYEIIASLDCDPYEERCFVYVCNPDPNVDGDDCTGDGEDDISYTKNIHRKAYNIPECNPNLDECEALECLPGEEHCFYELCGESNIPEESTCNDPEQYTRDNPIEEEEIECDETDEECDVEEELLECEEGDEECVLEEELIACEEGDEECEEGEVEVVIDEEE